MAFNNEGFALRSDLALRTEHPYLTTRIFEVEPHRFLIVFDAALLEASAVAELFHRTMRYVTTHIDLSNTLPETYLRELSPLGDRELARDFKGLPLTRSDLVNLLGAKVPALDVLDVGDPDGQRVDILIASGAPVEARARAEQILDGVAAGAAIRLVEADSAKRDLPQSSDPIGVVAHKFRSDLPVFVREDEDYWFDNLDALYAGKVKKTTLPGAQADGLACYIDFSMGERQLNLRQALLMYDTVYVTPPIYGGTDGWAAQQIPEEEWLRLAAAGRVKFVLTQPEERTNFDFLRAAHERNPDALVGRRAAGAWILADLVDTTARYRLNEPDFLAQAPTFINALGPAIGMDEKTALQVLLWPIYGLRRSVMPLMDRGALGAPALGLTDLVAQSLLDATGRDLRLETAVFGSQVHLAHALGATLVSPDGQADGHRFIQQMIADRLNFYRSFDVAVTAAWARNERRKEDARRLLPALPVFEFDVDVPLSEIEAAAGLASTRRKGRALIGRLANLDEAARSAELSRLAAELRKLKAKDAGVFSLETAEDLGSVVTAAGDVVGVATLGLPPVVASRNLFGRLTAALRQWKPADDFLDAIEHDLADQRKSSEDLDFLSKVDRVAVLNRPRVS